MNELKPNTIYTRQPDGKYCSGCGCNRSAMHCVEVDPATLVLPRIGGQRIVAGVSHYFRPNMLNVMASSLAADAAVNEAIADRPTSHQLASLPIIRAY